MAMSGRVVAPATALSPPPRAAEDEQPHRQPSTMETMSRCRRTRGGIINAGVTERVEPPPPPSPTPPDPPLAQDQLELLFLGTGTSAGVPMIACHCETCTSTDPHDKRTRPSVVISYPASVTNRPHAEGSGGATPRVSSTGEDAALRTAEDAALRTAANYGAVVVDREASGDRAASPS